MQPLINKVALIVGASRGIGCAIARDIARQGARTILASRDLAALTKEADALCAQGFEAVPMRLDVAEVDAITDLPNVDILVNVAGINIRKPFEQYTQPEIDYLLRTNLLGPLELTRRTARRMIERGTGGKIIFIGSLTSLLGLPHVSIYATAKSGLAGLTRALAAEWGQYNIQVNCIAPGFILTDFNRELWEPAEMRDWLAGVQANPRLGIPEDVAPLAGFLCGPQSNYITGQVITVDGGYATTAVWPLKLNAHK
jgi:gluconate 5-dehydrogenase